MSCWSVDAFDFFYVVKIERINRPTRHVLLHLGTVQYQQIKMDIYTGNIYTVKICQRISSSSWQCVLSMRRVSDIVGKWWFKPISSRRLKSISSHWSQSPYITINVSKVIYIQCLSCWYLITSNRKIVNIFRFGCTVIQPSSTTGLVPSWWQKVV